MKYCPSCNAAIEIDPEYVCDGDYLHCPGCGDDLEIVFLDGGGIALELVEYPEEEYLEGMERE